MTGREYRFLMNFHNLSASQPANLTDPGCKAGGQMKHCMTIMLPHSNKHTSAFWGY